MPFIFVSAFSIAVQSVENIDFFSHPYIPVSKVLSTDVVPFEGTFRTVYFSCSRCVTEIGLSLVLSDKI